SCSTSAIPAPMAPLTQQQFSRNSAVDLPWTAPGRIHRRECGRVLHGDQPEPGGEIAPPEKYLHWRREGLDRHGRDWPAAWLLGKKAEDFLARELLSKG